MIPSPNPPKQPIAETSRTSSTPTARYLSPSEPLARGFSPTRSAKVLNHCLHDHRKKIDMTAVVVMPDHVHMLFACRTDADGNTYGLSEVLSGIKGASAHSVNRLLNRRGHVWQYESFDHILRCEDSIHEAADYICQNPVRKGLVKSEDRWPWLWRSWVEGTSETAGR